MKNKIKSEDSERTIINKSALKQTIMKDELVTLETAKLAKELGFDKVICRDIYAVKTKDGWYNPEGISVDYAIQVFDDTDNKRYLAPTQSLLSRWLREKHGIQVEARPTYPINPAFCAFIYDLNNWHITSGNFYVYEGFFVVDESNLVAQYTTYEYALEAALLKALEHLKTKK